MKNIEGGFGTPGPEAKEEYEKKVLSVKRESEERKMVGGLRKEAQFGPEAKRNILQFLAQERGRIRVKFAKDWWEKGANVGEIKEAGHDPEEDSAIIMRAFYEEMGGFGKLEISDEGVEIDNLLTLEEEIQEGDVSLGGQCILLYELSKEAERIGSEEKVGETEEEKKARQDIFKLRKQVAEKIIGRNLIEQINIANIERGVGLTEARNKKGILGIGGPSRTEIAEMEATVKEEIEKIEEEKISKIFGSQERITDIIEDKYSKLREGRAAKWFAYQAEYTARKLETSQELKKTREMLNKGGIDIREMQNRVSYVEGIREDPKKLGEFLAGYGLVERGTGTDAKLEGLQKKGEGKGLADWLLFVLSSLLEGVR